MPIQHRHSHQPNEAAKVLNPIMKSFVACLFLLGSIWFCRTAEPAPASAASHQYRGGFATVLRLGMDIRRMMNPQYRDQFPPNPVFMDLDLTPAARPAVITTGNKSYNGVMVTAGFIDLANNVAHAHAIDRAQPGYFDQYLARLSQESGDRELAAPPNVDDDAFWTESIRNEQLTDFNQIVGMVVAINLAHIYLGQYAEHALQLKDADGNPVPLARVMSHHQWLEAMRTATKNSLDTGLGMSGYIALCEAIGRMPARPAWTEYFMPRHMSAAKLRSELRIIEASYFSGRSVD